MKWIKINVQVYHIVINAFPLVGSPTNSTWPSPYNDKA